MRSDWPTEQLRGEGKGFFCESSVGTEGSDAEHHMHTSLEPASARVLKAVAW